MKVAERLSKFLKNNEGALVMLAEALGRMVGTLIAYAAVATLVFAILAGVFGLGLSWWQVFSGIVLIRVVRALLVNG